MPRIKLNRRKDMDRDLYSWILGQMKYKHYTQAKLGKELGYSQSALSKRIEHKTLTTYDLICIFSLFDTEPETISKLLKEKR